MIIFLCIGAGDYLYLHQKHLIFQQKYCNKHSNVLCTISSIEPTKNVSYPWQLICKSDEGNFIQLYLKDKKDFAIDDTVNFKNIFIRPCTNNDYAQYLMKENISASVFLANPSYEIIHRPAFSVARSIDNVRSTLLATIEKKLSPSAGNLLSSLFFGNKQNATTDQEMIKDDFKQWGISHYLARSGLHVVTLIFVWHFIMRLIPMPLVIKDILLLLLMIMYWLLSWNSISFLRAFLTFLAYKVCHLTMVAPHTLHIITLITFVVLLCNPLQLFFLDFQLSFALTFALALYQYL